MALNSVERYQASDNRWRPCVSMLEPRSACGVVSVSHPRPLLFAVGGITSYGETSASGEVFDPSTQAWKSIAPMLSPRRSFGLASLGGVLYAVGGSDGASDLRSVEAYDISSRTWRAVAPMSRARMYCTVTVFEGSVLAIGGMDGMLTLNTVERYCAATDRWMPFLTLPKTVCGCAAVVADCVSASLFRSTPKKRSHNAITDDGGDDDDDIADRVPSRREPSLAPSSAEGGVGAVSTALQGLADDGDDDDDVASDFVATDDGSSEGEVE